MRVWKSRWIRCACQLRKSSPVFQQGQIVIYVACVSAHTQNHSDNTHEHIFNEWVLNKKVHFMIYWIFPCSDYTSITIISLYYKWNWNILYNLFLMLVYIASETLYHSLIWYCNIIVIKNVIFMFSFLSMYDLKT